jgi:hypothetical protein
VCWRARVATHRVVDGLADRRLSQRSGVGDQRSEGKLRRKNYKLEVGRNRGSRVTGKKSLRQEWCEVNGMPISFTCAVARSIVGIDEHGA